MASSVSGAPRWERNIPTRRVVRVIPQNPQNAQIYSQPARESNPECAKVQDPEGALDAPLLKFPQTRQAGNHAGTPRYYRLHYGFKTAPDWATGAACSAGQSLSAANRATPAGQC